MALQNTNIAASGSNGHHNFILYISEHSTDVSSNTSNIGFTFQISSIQNGWDWSWSGAMSWSLSVAGYNYSGKLDSYDGKSTITIKSDTFNVAHNTDGNKTINFSFSVSSYNYNYLPGSASKSGSLALTFIPRKATITSAPNFNDTQNPTITFTNPAGTAATIGVYIEKEDGTNLVARWAPSGSTSYTFSDISETERYRFWNAVVSGTSATIRYRVRTIIGDYDDSHTVNRTLTLTDALPTISATVRDVGGVSTSLTGNANNKMIKYYNIMEYSISASGKKGATITEYSCINGGNKYTGATGSIGYTGSNTFEFTVKDSRGNTKTTTITKEMIDYINLTCDLKVEKPTIEGYLAFEISGNYWSGDFGATANTINVEYRIKEGYGEWSEWRNKNPIIYPQENKYITSPTISGLDYTKSYTVQARAYDKVNQLDNGDEIYTPEYTVKALPVFDWSETDFNLNVPLMINNVEQDAIVESGSSGIWKYKKYESGLAECWGRFAFTTTLNTAWGTMYVGSTKSSRQTYPITFIESPVENATLLATNYAAWIFPESGSTGINSNTQSAVYNICRPTSGGTSSHTFFICLQVVGRWK